MQKRGCIIRLLRDGEWGVGEWGISCVVPQHTQSAIATAPAHHDDQAQNIAPLSKSDRIYMNGTKFSFIC
ncbi:hypothetical protein I8748_06155 [Nostoc sp. CENA67]|uniref:Uncharacterized protein n=1 Tax=Amazonocrinis nigriterrae CENA67 TaxID=2794033 RepID=A0A8J7HLD4_9NOST|nr:hypothetical protein [Amazonocrinis nigriterrae]MBH8561761.1 hypothetical protein [Amazonocrinis nigriterrae CENA67]